MIRIFDKVGQEIQILKKLTFRKVVNLIALRSSYILSKRLKKSIHWGLPSSISIEPTTACNLKCPECPSGLRQFTRSTGNLKKELNAQIIDEIGPYLSYINYYFQGEPFINPMFLEMIQYAHKKNIYTATSTNGHFLDKKTSAKTVKSGLDALIISIDGTTQETYSKYRKEGSLDKVIEGTKNVIEAKNKLNSKTPYIIFQYLVVKPNEHQIEDAKSLADELGVDEIRFKTAQVYDYKNGNELIPTREEYSRYKKLPDGTYKIKNKLTNSCWRMWSGCVFTQNGAVVPCCFDKDAKHQLGQLSEKPFKSIWKNRKYTEFRGTVIRSRKEIDICKNCSEGTKVWT